jgi:hypothetical protein
MTANTKTGTGAKLPESKPFALSPETLAAIAAVDEAEGQCNRLDAAINAIPQERLALERERDAIAAKLAEAESAAVLCLPGSDGEVSTLKSIEKLNLALLDKEQQLRRIDRKVTALEEKGVALHTELMARVSELRVEANIVLGDLKSRISGEYRQALPPLLRAHARLKALRVLHDPTSIDCLQAGYLADPATRFMVLTGAGAGTPDYRGINLLDQPDMGADAVQAELEDELKPIAKALQCGNRPPFKPLAQRVQQPYVKRGIEVSGAPATIAALLS